MLQRASSTGQSAAQVGLVSKVRYKEDHVHSIFRMELFSLPKLKDILVG